MDEKFAKKGRGRVKDIVGEVLKSRKPVSSGKSSPTTIEGSVPPLRVALLQEKQRSGLGNSGKVADKASGKISDKASGKVADKVSGKVADKVSGKVADKVADKVVGKVADKASGKISAKISAKISGKISDKPSTIAPSDFKSRVSALDRSGYWQGQMLLASPAICDTRFERSIVYLCHQGKDGALGLVVNKVAEKIQFTDVLDHLSIPVSSDFDGISVHVGGPIESSRGFVLHSPEKHFSGTIALGDLAMTASADILQHIAHGKGPRHYVFLLGYAGWGTGQLDKEIASNAWLHLPFDSDLVFGEDNQDKWSRAMDRLGVSPHLLSGVSGNA